MQAKAGAQMVICNKRGVELSIIAVFDQFARLIHMTRNEILNGALSLPMDERIQLVEEVWESIAESPEAIELTDEQRQELNRRLVARAQGEWRGSPWEVVKQRIVRGES